MSAVMEGGDTRASNIQLSLMEESELWKQIERTGSPKVERYEPKIPFTAIPRATFQAPEPFDVICLARSPSFTPRESDALFDLIRASFIDETFFGHGEGTSSPRVTLG
jgi:hypothetical protein